MNRLIAMGAALALSGCQCINPRDVTGFKCGEGSACETGMTCCNDGFCRASCTTGSGGGSASGGPGGGSGGSGGGDTGGGTGGGSGGGTGGGAACVAGNACTGNPGAPCKLGRTACAGMMSQCEDNKNELDGTSCGGTNVCSNGVCTTCTNGSLCATNPNRCVTGQLDCSGATPACTDTTTQRMAGSSCGIDKVCNAAGMCIDCKQGAACMGNSNVCKQGTQECGSGTPTCLDGMNKPGGASCGNNQICDGSGNCITCVENAACSTNPDVCKNGQLRCGGAAPMCVDGTPKNPGDSCGQNQVCSPAGACIMCKAMDACMGNPTPCKQGATSCRTGASVCEDTTANRNPGTSCGTDKVCDTSGACIACAAGAVCTGNPDVCKQGVTDCSAGRPVCVDGTQNSSNGTPCGMGQTCNGGVCGMCVQGAMCTGNPTPCRVGTRDCTGATPVCNDGMGNRPPGTSCGTNQVCNAAGSCVACTAGQSCLTNSNPCRQGITSCMTGAQTCENGTDVPDGTSCTGGFCVAGACLQCNIGGSCTTNPTPCKTGALARSGTQCVCNDDRDDPVGTQPGCTSGMTCNGMGSCVQCGFTCNIGVCRRGAVSCATLMCTDVGAEADGTTCPGGQCSGGACCAGCRVAGTCQPGGAITACGLAGNICRDCTVTAFGPCMYADECSTTGSRIRTDGTCVNGGCSTNTTTVTNDPACARSTTGVPCASGFGTCHSGACCTGCIGGGLCRPGTTNQYCGAGGANCIMCPATRFCDPGPPAFCDFP